MFFFLISCNNKSTEECKTDVRAYEFGREMESWVYLRSSGLSLNDAIFEYSRGLGINPPYDSSNPCVKRGFSDSKKNIKSPYNSKGRSWSSF
jgi:hypothetical protein